MYNEKVENILNFLGFDEKKILDFDYMIKLIKKFELEEKIKLEINNNDFNNKESIYESIFKISLYTIISEIIFKLGKKLELEDVENFELYYLEIYFEEPKSKPVEFLLKNNIENIEMEEILNMFEEWNKEDIEKYINY
jgi:hypothetical protein